MIRKVWKKSKKFSIKSNPKNNFSIFSISVGQNDGLLLKMAFFGREKLAWTKKNGRAQVLVKIAPAEVPEAGKAAKSP